MAKKNTGFKVNRLALLDIMTEKGISQIELANQCGFTKDTINRIVRGVTSPQTRTIVKIAQVLGVKPSQIAVQVNINK